MPIHEYPFVMLQKGSLARPMLPIRIINPDTGIAIPAWGLIDTGADDCAIPAKFAPMIGHNLQLGRERRVGTGNGVTIAYAHKTNIEILKVEGDTVLENVVVENVTGTPIDYMPNLDTILLGVDNFLDWFVLEIDYPRCCFSLRRR